ncbi:hydroxyacyl-coenzyme A dehydrogenase, mitochondrial-like [Wyeomyia smithii]|uniref:hydroxyacyl-coenzyme A dehydrogenase, mitochondrial-like n=1 Tax=Wyeomyia smithii TaxID=174621 RepID=UPI002467E166|nr:hydroxyacyl-coenzyme A dehydrogenase, mitochondrial-like [Wyeomyia smithii]XP_055536749.1 hydroxyacyl-coenzyme A dehydrogenase, mitochondrial-like [Wyeomyia smithii]XP_055536750.1 hydroxyacyl-coenzyme A dehydrogenase, mitochondrial-like [Wyeomyia smithii]
MTPPIKSVVIVGAGTMGSGIAMVAATTGHNTTLVDIDQSLLDKARSQIEKNTDRFARKTFKADLDSAKSFVSESLSNIRYTLGLEEAVSNADIVIEAIVESMKIKQQLFKRIDNIAPPHVIFVSNTSSLSIQEMGEVTKRQDRFAGLHFFNPVPLMKLIEVIKTDKTSEETFATLMAFGGSLGKTCIKCKDTPGFIVNRLLFSLTSEAQQMLERGDATARDIDMATKLGLGHPMGPFELMDMVGLDVTLSIMQERQSRFPDDPRSKPSPILEKMVASGKLGVKSGEGFYNYK